MRILIVKPSSLGDIIHAMVVVSELKRQRPDCTIDWVVRDCFSNVIRQSRIAERVLIYERHGGFSSMLRLISEIREQNYDYVFDMQGLARSGFMTYFAKSPNKIGRKDSRELSFLAYTKTINYPGPAHAIDVLKEFLNIVGCNGEVSGFVPELRNISSPVYFELLKNKIQNKKFICLFPESRRIEKEWKFFPVFAAKLSKILPEVIICLLGNGFSESYEVSEKLLDLRGKTSITDVIYLIQHAQLIIANDSGPLHISAALGRPTLGLFTATDPLRFGPYPLHKESNVALRLKNLPKDVDTVLQTALKMFNF